MPFFKLVRGRHAHAGKVYEPGDVFETDEDLTLGNFPGAERWLPAVDPKTVKAAPKKAKDEAGADAAFANMTIAELRSYAAEGEINLGDATTKKELIAAIKKAEA